MRGKVSGMIMCKNASYWLLPSAADYGTFQLMDLNLEIDGKTLGARRKVLLEPTRQTGGSIEICQELMDWFWLVNLIPFL